MFVDPELIKQEQQAMRSMGFLMPSLAELEEMTLNKQDEKQKKSPAVTNRRRHFPFSMFHSSYTVMNSSGQ